MIENSRLILNETDNAFYRDCLTPQTPSDPRGLPRSNTLLWKSFHYFTKRLDDLPDLRDDGTPLARMLSETVIRCFLFILITVDDPLDACTALATSAAVRNRQPPIC